MEVIVVIVVLVLLFGGGGFYGYRGGTFAGPGPGIIGLIVLVILIILVIRFLGGAYIPSVLNQIKPKKLGFGNGNLKAAWLADATA